MSRRKRDKRDGKNTTKRKSSASAKQPIDSTHTQSPADLPEAGELTPEQRKVGRFPWWMDGSDCDFPDCGCYGTAPVDVATIPSHKLRCAWDGNRKEIIAPLHLTTYERRVHDIWNRLITIDSNLTLLDHFIQAQILGEIGNCLILRSLELREVLSNLAMSAYNETIMVLWNLLYDKDSRSITIVQLRIDLEKKMLLSGYSKFFRKDVEPFVTGSSSERLDELKPIITNYRDFYYAHRNAKAKEQGNVLFPGMTVLRELAEIARNYFAVCRFGINHEYRTNTVEQGGGQLTDVLIANGLYVNLPELDPSWPHLLQAGKYSDEELTKLNEYRDKYGRPRVERLEPPST